MSQKKFIELEFDVIGKDITDDVVYFVLDSFTVVGDKELEDEIELVKKAGTWRLRIPIPDK
ncbi:MAG: hypothetical protein ACTSV7_00110 [Candidatus Baldrarchaeia archaeon]